MLRLLPWVFVALLILSCSNDTSTESDQTTRTFSAVAGDFDSWQWQERQADSLCQSLGYKRHVAGSVKARKHFCGSYITELTCEQ